MAEGHQLAALALADAAQGQSLWETAVRHDIPAATCMEIALVFAALAARSAGVSPRAVCNNLFKEAPDDEEWRWRFLPLLDSMARD